MSVSVSPHTRFAAALIAAGVVSAASVVSLPAPTMRVDVANASVVTDALSAFGKSVEVASSLVGIHVDATLSLPFEATLAVLASQQHPELGSSVLSYLVQRFVNPAVGAPIYAYPWETEQTAALVASLLAYPLGPSATDPGLVNQARLAFAAAFDGVLKHLGDPLPGFGAVQDVMNDTALGGAVVAGQLAVRAPLYMAWNTVNYFGNLPVNVEASIESAISDPRQIPGLISNLAYGLLSPDANVGLLGKLLNNAVDPLTWLPAPIGFGSPTAVGLANQVRAAISDVVNKVLASLPTPVTPSVLPAGTAGQGQPIYSVGAGKGATAPDALPSASLTDTSLVTLSKVANEPTLSKVVAMRSADSVSTATGLGDEESSGNGTKGVSPQTTPAVADPVPNPKPLTNVLRSGNKVKPGEKFAGKDDATAGSGDEAVDETPSTTTGSAVDAPKVESPHDQTPKADADAAPSSDDSTGAAA